MLPDTVSYPVGPANIDGFPFFVESIDPLAGETLQATLDGLRGTILEFLQ